jgi:surface protein
MTSQNDTHGFVVPAPNANLYDLQYSQIRGGSVGCTISVNGTIVNMAPSSKINIANPSISGGTGCFLAGKEPVVETGKKFITSWITSNLSTGSSGTNQIKLPLIASGTYNFRVEWGDGTSDVITTWNQAAVTHTYTTAGFKRISIVGTLIGWEFFTANSDRLKITSVDQWGKVKYISTGGYFGCANLMLNNVRGLPDFSSLTSLGSFFNGCANLTKINNINNWDVSNITNFQQMFGDCLEFDDNIGNWDTSKATNLSFMFYATGSLFTKFNNGGSDSIKNWNTSKVTTMSAMFQRNIAFNQDVGTKVVTNNKGQTYIAWDTSNVIDMSGLFNVGATAPTHAPGGKFNNGGSDSIKNWNTSKVTTISAMFYGQPFFNQDIGTKVVTVSGSSYIAWDIKNVTTMSTMLSCTIVTGRGGSFNNGGSDSIKNWNTSKVTTISGMFNSQILFNQDIGTKVVTVSGSPYVAWDTSEMTNMSGPFFCSSNVGRSGVFNNGGSDSIKNWNTSKATNISFMFWNQIFFNQDIGTKVVTVSGSPYVAWNTSNVTNMAQMLGVDNFYILETGKFNNGGSDSIKNWNTSKVTNISFMFYGQPFFNQDVGTKQVTVSGSPYVAWSTSNVTNMGAVFGFDNKVISGGVFNNGGSDSIKNWDTSKVTTMSFMFKNQDSFNQDIGTKQVTVSASTYSAWTMSAATSISSMLNVGSGLVGVFNNGGSDSIKNWDTSNVTVMGNVFRGQKSFNQPINTWNTGKVTGMTGTFYLATGFNQPISNWNISGVTVFNDTTSLPGGFMEGKSSNDYSVANYDALLIGWSAQSVKSGLTINFGTIKYSSSATTARNILLNSPNFWTIIDGGLI